MKYVEEYMCGCCSPPVRGRKNLLGYCPKHGANRRYLHYENVFDPKAVEKVAKAEREKSA